MSKLVHLVFLIDLGNYGQAWVGFDWLCVIVSSLCHCSMRNHCKILLTYLWDIWSCLTCDWPVITNPAISLVEIWYLFHVHIRHIHQGYHVNLARYPTRRSRSWCLRSVFYKVSKKPSVLMSKLRFMTRVNVVATLHQLTVLKCRNIIHKRALVSVTTCKSFSVPNVAGKKRESKKIFIYHFLSHNFQFITEWMTNHESML